MKRYFAFYGDCYYPSGGMGDFVGDFDTVDECNNYIDLLHSKNRPNDIIWEWAWKSIWDSQNKTYIIGNRSY